MLSDPFPGLILELFSYGVLQFKHSTTLSYVVQLMATDTSITPGTLSTIISSVTKQMQLWSKTKTQYSYHFENYSTTLLGV